MKKNLLVVFVLSAFLLLANSALAIDKSECGCKTTDCKCSEKCDCGCSASNDCKCCDSDKKGCCLKENCCDENCSCSKRKFLFFKKKCKCCC